MNRLFKILVLILVLTCTNYTLRAFAASDFAGGQKTAALDFSLYNLDDVKVNLSDYKDKKSVLLFFWATWCPLCRIEFKELVEYYPELAKNNIEVLAINIAESKKRIERFLKGYTIDFMVLLDSDGGVSLSYGLVGIPTYILVDKKSNIIFRDHTLPKNYKTLLSR